ncbi:hypothetical protein ZWY2020_025717 [Hordeum vulgare]|nr:hypothetical protein ZWY2020_025717 [Hordeum vulgare]
MPDTALPHDAMLDIARGTTLPDVPLGVFLDGHIARVTANARDASETADTIEIEPAFAPARSSSPRYELPDIPEGYVLEGEIAEDFLACHPKRIDQDSQGINAHTPGHPKEKKKDDRNLHAATPNTVTPEEPNDISASDEETQSNDEHEPGDNMESDVHNDAQPSNVEDVEIEPTVNPDNPQPKRYDKNDFTARKHGKEREPWVQRPMPIPPKPSKKKDDEDFEHFVEMIRPVFLQMRLTDMLKISPYAKVPFGKINIFISMIGSSAPEPDISTDIVEPARYVHQVVTPYLTRPVFVGFTQGSEETERSATQGTTPVNSDDESSMGDSDSIRSLHGDCLGSLSLAMDPEILDRTRRQIAIYMASATQPTQNPTGGDGTGGTSRSPATVLVDLAAEVTRLMATPLTPENQEEINTELEKLREAVEKAHRDTEMESTRIETRQAQITAERMRLNTDNWRLERQQRASDAVHQRRHQGRLPHDLNPTRLFDTPRTQAEPPRRRRAARLTPWLSRLRITFPDSGRLKATFPTRWITCLPQLAIWSLFRYTATPLPR